MNNLEWFYTLNKPLLNPPAWLFAPVWTILYIMMGLSLVFLIKNGATRSKQKPVILFIIQLVLNLLWVPTFFGNKNILGGLIIIILLSIFILWTIISFYKHSKIAAGLLIPYFLWVLFATYLNYQYYALN